MKTSKRVAISEFKAHCLEILSNVSTTKDSIIITKRDKEIAKVIPFNSKKKSVFGMFKGQVEITGDIVAPLNVKWDADK